MTNTNPVRAFPAQGGAPGMTLRDYFAAQAIVGLAARTIEGNMEPTSFVHDAAKVAYEIADAMMKARDKENAK